MSRTLTAAAESLPLAHPFRISRGVKTAAEVVTVEIADGDCVGRGEAVPYPRYGETVADALAAIRDAAPGLNQGATRDELIALMPAGAARNAVDCALWDLEARLQRRSVAAMIGQPEPAPVATAMTVGLDTPEKMAQAARALAHVPLLKVKVDGSDPEAQLAAVRAAAPRPRLIVDPNESWTIAHVRSLQPLLAELRVDVLEQPLPAGEDEELAGLSPTVPIAADESVHVLDDVRRLADRYQIINIKLDKTGGLTTALRLARAAEDQGLGVMVGCMICSSLSIAPALHLAARAAFADLDGPFWLVDDRAGGVREKGGMLIPPEAGFWG